MSRLSLRDRVALASAAVLAAGLIVLGIGVALLLSHQASADASTRLGERADALLSTLSLRGGRLVVRDAADDATLDSQAWVFDANGRAVERPRAGTKTQHAAQELAGVVSDTEREVGNLRLRADPAYTGDRKRHIGTVVVGVSLAPAERTRHVALLAMGVLGLFVLAAGALLARRAVGNALRPVADMTARAADWSEHDLDRRFGLGPPRDELTALSATLDGLLGRIAASLRHEQRFSSEMAHELRTPLAGVRGEAELALREPGLPGATRAALEQILAGVERMQTVIETLLVAARGEAGAGAAVADIRAVIDEVARNATVTATGAGVTVHVEDPAVPSARPVRAGVDAALATQALAPLVDNAVRHADHAVHIEVLVGEQVVIAVRDDGAGISAADAEAVFAPGHSTEGGAGLGLALALRLARSGGGDVVAVPDVEGGRVELRLPAVDA